MYCVPNFSQQCRQVMSCGAPQGSGGNGIVNVNYPYGVTKVKYFPSGSSSVGRSMWDGWRYGSNYTGPNERKIYGEPDFKYYKHKYCGPCGCMPDGYMGDPYGQNPNIRYVPLDYKHLLSSGFAQQEQSECETSPCKIGQDSRVNMNNKTEKPVKFQIHIGDENQPETMPPPPRNNIRVYVPNQMLPGSGDGEFEVQIPGLSDIDTSSKDQVSPCLKQISAASECVNPCGSCNACKIAKMNAKCSNVKECTQNGQRYTTCPVLCNVKRPIRPNYGLRKSVRRKCNN